MVNSFYSISVIEGFPHELSTRPARVQIQKELISVLMRKNAKIRGKRLGTSIYRLMGNAIPKQGLNRAIPDG